jgi:DNA-binding CsgD family transcriptional regulator/extradiol dioxygenase family protein
MRKVRGRPPTNDLLTPAEWSVVNGVRHGSSNPSIARRLGVSLDAVKYHVSNAMQKLGFLRRAQLRQWQGVAQKSALSNQGRPDTKQPKVRASQPMKNIPNFEVPATAEHPLECIAQIARTVASIDAARRWYADVAGLRHLYSFGKMAFFDCAGLRLMLSEPEAGDKPKKSSSRAKPSRATSESLLYFRVSDIHAARSALEARGAIFINAPHLVHRHEDGTEEWMTFFQDNEARPLALVSQVKPSSKTPQI